MINTGQKFLSALMAVTLRSRSQTYNLNVKVLVKVFKTSLFLNLTTNLIQLWDDDTYWSRILRITIPTPLGHVKI